MSAIEHSIPINESPHLPYCETWCWVFMLLICKVLASGNCGENCNPEMPWTLGVFKSKETLLRKDGTWSEFEFSPWQKLILRYFVRLLLCFFFLLLLLFFTLQYCFLYCQPKPSPIIRQAWVKPYVLGMVQWVYSLKLKTGPSFKTLFSPQLLTFLLICWSRSCQNWQLGLWYASGWDHCRSSLIYHGVTSQ